MNVELDAPRHAVGELRDLPGVRRVLERGQDDAVLPVGGALAGMHEVLAVRRGHDVVDGYIEPITLPYLTKIIEVERPDALLPTVGGQTALNAALSLVHAGVLKKYNVELIGAKEEAIKKAEDRKLFKEAMEKIGVKMPMSGIVTSMEAALELLEKIGLPAILRPSFTLGGSGGGICYNREEYISMVSKALAESPTSQVLIDQSILGWKEYELEVDARHGG